MAGILSVLFGVYLLSGFGRCLHIIDPEVCSIPYIVPLIFQTECDRTDEYYHTDIEIEDTKGDTLDFTLPDPFVASVFVQRKPAIWTHEPFCLESFEAQNGYCVYTDARFGSGKGLSMIATPWMVKDIAENVPIFRDRSGLDLQSVNDAKQKHHRKLMENGDGWYVVANTTFVRGERVSSITSPLIMQRTGNMLLTPAQQSLLLRVAINRLPPEERQKYLSQYLTPGEDAYFDRLEKNSFNTAVGLQQYPFVSSIPESSIYNHDCRSNLGYHFNPKTMAHEIYVIRDIQAGEEMTVSYLAPYDNSSIREAKLAGSWKFKCNCKLCTASAPKKRASDRRLRIIERLIDILNLPFSQREPDPRQALELVKLHEKEELWGSIAGAHMNVAMEYMQLGERQNALKWARTAKESLVLWSGTGHPYYTGMTKMVKDLEKAEAEV